MKIFRLALGMSAIAAFSAGNAEAALLNVVQSFPDVTLNTPWLVYDHNAVNTTTGRLMLIAGGSTLNEQPSLGGTSQTQSYFAAGDSKSDLMLSFDINNTTGALVGGNVSISFGNNTTTPRFSWTGTVTEFGFNESLGINGGRIFDAKWVMSGDLYQNIPANMSQFVNSYLTGLNGGIIISTSNNSFVGTASFLNDWVFGSSATTATLATSVISNYVSGLDANVIKLNSTITADAFVPVPAAAWLMSSALLCFVPAIRKKANLAA